MADTSTLPSSRTATCKANQRRTSRPACGRLRRSTEATSSPQRINRRGAAEIKRLLTGYTLDNLNHSGLKLSSSACVAFQTCGMLRVFSGPYKHDVGGRCSVVFRVGHGWIRACTCTAGFRYLTLAPDFHSVSSGVHRESGLC